MKLSFRHFTAAAALAAACATVPASAAFIHSDLAETNAQLGTRADTKGTIGTFNFANPANTLGDITSLSITLTLYDGDTGSGNFDEHQLHLVLDGIDTGLLLDGFRNDQTDTRTNSFTIPLTGQGTSLAKSIYDALVSDSALVAEILDLDDDDLAPNGTGESNSRNNFMRLPRDNTATLTLTGDAPITTSAAAVPEPASLALTALGLAGLALSRRRRTN